MSLRPRLPRLWTSLALATVALFSAATLSPLVTSSTNASELRRTEMVRAVEKTRSSVVNIRGQKTVREDGAAAREVNGMGTGVVIDARGYIITNNHVVEGVRKIEVTLCDGTMLVARLISTDPKTDLALIKVDRDEKFPVITVGTSSDLMIAEPVVAMGNAYGYEHTVTRGIVSALHRTVQVSDAQQYDDLIQTDASINPGNSGGPLLNVDGEMIGINVAVRAGAQGIGFAIPVDNAMAVAARLLSIERIDHNWHGVVGKPVENGGKHRFVIDKVAESSPAASGELKPGDVITSMGDLAVERPLDVERALLGRKAGEEVPVTVERDGKPLKLSLVLAAKGRGVLGPDEHVWDTLGMKLAAISTRELRDQLNKYRGGLKVVEVKPDGPARKQGIRTGDILVGMHVWETISLDNVEYILNRPELNEIVPVKFYIVRDGETLIGRLPIVPPTATK
ncbi:MAG: trypsin-like peptidase domain-containing protein [Pirellulales bacterium]